MAATFDLFSAPPARRSAGWTALIIGALIALLTASLWATALSAYPRDPERTLETVLASGAMTVAVSENPPWVVLKDGEPPIGAEVALVSGFADTLGVSVDWLRLPGFEALHAVEQGKADLAIGGFLRQDVTSHGIAAPSYGYFRETLLIAMPAGGDAPQDLEDVSIAVPPDLVAERFIRDKGAQPTEDASASPLVALPHWRVEDLGLVSTATVLARRDHVFAVKKGENAWLFRLEQYLRTQEQDVPALLRSVP